MMSSLILGPLVAGAVGLFFWLVRAVVKEIAAEVASLRGLHDAFDEMASSNDRQHETVAAELAGISDDVTEIRQRVDKVAEDLAATREETAALRGAWEVLRAVREP